MIHFWHQLRHYGMQHGVDPRIFAALYFARLPFLLATLAALVGRMRRRQRPLLPMTLLFLGLGVLPYTYILVFGHDLPTSFVAVTAAIAGLTVAQSLRKLRDALRTNLIPATENDSR